jgi:hypothetical protein
LTGRNASWPQSVRNRSRNPALALSGTTNRTPAWSISLSVFGAPIAESHTISNPCPETLSSRSRLAPTNVNSAAFPGSGRL